MALAMERINVRCNISARRLTGNMGRKTNVTFSRNLFGHTDEVTKRVTHHDDEVSFKTYDDEGYSNLERDTMISTDFQDFEQDRYNPLIMEAVPRQMTNMQTQLDRLTKMMKARKPVIWKTYELCFRVRKICKQIFVLVKIVCIIVLRWFIHGFRRTR